MKKLLFISCIVPKECRKELVKGAKSLVPYSEAANTYQQSIIDGLVQNKISFDVFTAPSLPAYPMGYQRLSIPSIKTEVDVKFNLEVIPYSTFFLWKYTSIEFLLEKRIMKWVKENEGYELSILIYNVDSAFMSAVKSVKRKYPKLKTAIIITDMMEDINNFASNRNFMKRVQLSLHKRKVFNSYEAIDKFILLSELMKERISNCTDNYIVAEGIFTPQKSIQDSDVEKQKFIFYSGALDAYVNIPEMIEAYKQMGNTEYQLVICGDGPLVGYVKEEAKKNEGIVFLGSIPRQEVLEWQRKSSLLVNPRQPSEITKYSFPSKTMEYFASGTPVLMYKLQGIPDEYYLYCYTIEGNSVENFSKSMQCVLQQISETSFRKGFEAQQFVLKNKTSSIQTKRIIDFIYGLK